MNNYYIEVISFENNEVIKTLGPANERRADKIDDGVNINLNHDKFYTRIIQK